MNDTVCTLGSFDEHISLDDPKPDFAILPMRITDGKYPDKCGACRNRRECSACHGSGEHDCECSKCPGGECDECEGTGLCLTCMVDDPKDLEPNEKLVYVIVRIKERRDPNAYRIACDSIARTNAQLATLKSYPKEFVDKIFERKETPNVRKA